VATWDVLTMKDHVLVTLRGTLGIAEAGPLRLALLEALGHEQPVRIDCTALDHLDCASAQVVLSFASALERRALSVEWSPLPDGPREYLALAGLLDHFGQATSADEAHR
jgi:anti-anti-sigma regulatory factor